MAKRKKSTTIERRVALRKKNLLKALEQTMGHVAQACNNANCSRKTYYLYIQEDEEFAQNVYDLKESLIDDAETELRKLIKEGDRTAIIFFLKTQAKDRGYVERSELAGVKDKPVFTVNLNDYL